MDYLWIGLLPTYNCGAVVNRGLWICLCNGFISDIFGLQCPRMQLGISFRFVFEERSFRFTIESLVSVYPVSIVVEN